MDIIEHMFVFVNSYSGDFFELIKVLIRVCSDMFGKVFTAVVCFEGERVSSMILVKP